MTCLVPRRFFLLTALFATPLMWIIGTVITVVRSTP